MVEAVHVPVVGIGGIDIARAPDIARAGAAGAAVVGAVMSAEDPQRAAAELMSAFRVER